jgi:hypothetical protein
MEVSVVRQRLHATIERAKRRAADRRSRSDQAGVAFGRFLETTAVPLFRQIANVLRADGYLFNMFTPPGGVGLMSDRRPEDRIELRLDSSGDKPHLVLHSSRTWGGGVLESEKAIGDPEMLTEDELLAAVLAELEPFVER